MKITKTPSGDYYLQKSKDQSLMGTFWWGVRTKKNQGVVYLSTQVDVPKELIGKKLMFKIELMEEKKNE